MSLEKRSGAMISLGVEEVDPGEMQSRRKQVLRARDFYKLPHCILRGGPWGAIKK